MQAVIERSSANNWLESCVSTYSCIDKRSKDLTYYMNNLLEIEFDLCDEVFKNNGSNVSVDCFVRIVFGNTVAESKKDAVKLFKLLKIFHTLNKLRLDFNRLFGGKSCNGIQTPTRNLDILGASAAGGGS